MNYKTFSQIKEKIERELDLETEDFIQPEEFKEYVNDAIEVAQAEIHKLGIQDEYFLKRSYISLTQGQSEYDLPTDIYANKIKKIVYNNGATVYEVKRYTNLARFEDSARISNQTSATDYYNYMLINSGPTVKPKILISPEAKETTTDAFEIWYFRSANTWSTDDSALCDVPEVALQYLYAYVRYRCLDKEGHPNQAEAKEQMLLARQLMVDTLTNMVPDEDSEIDKDMSFYNDFT